MKNTHSYQPSLPSQVPTVGCMRLYPDHFVDATGIFLNVNIEKNRKEKMGT